MNPLEALQLLINAASLARLTKAEHVQIEQAGVALAQELQKRQAKKEKAGKDGAADA